MATEQLIEYVRDQIGKGVSHEEIAKALLALRWPAHEISSAFASLGVSATVSPPLPTSTASIESASASAQSVPASPNTPAAPAGGLPAIANAVPTVKYAGFWMRAAALIIDGIVLSVLQFVVGLLLEDGLLERVISSLLYVSYAIFMITAYQATLGKMAVGLRVQRTNGERVGLAHAVLRELVGKFCSAITLGIGYLMVAWTGKKQGLHDKIAETVVIEKDPTKSKTVWVVLAVIFVLALPIVGILSSVVLASLNVARMKGYDAAVQSRLLSVVAEAELYRDTIGNGGYVGFCGSPLPVSSLTEASRAGTADGNASSYTCNDSQNGWAASAPLRQGGYGCVDSTRVYSTAASSLMGGQISCNSPTP